MKLQIKNSTVAYGGDEILYQANFEVLANEKIAVVGRNGCGKTTLLKLISGELSPANEDAEITFAGGVTVGALKQLSFEDGTVSAESEIKKSFAHIYACRDELEKTEKLIAENPSEILLKRLDSLQKRFDSYGGLDCERDMVIMFQKFGFAASDLKKPIGEFSGGQQTKIAFMKLLLSHPEVLLLDEPTNHLDLPAIEWLEDYLKSYKSAVVIVSHDRAFLDSLCTVTYEIEWGIVTKYSGNYSAFVKQKEANYEKQLKDWKAQQAEIKRLTEWCEQWKNTPTKISSVRSKQKQIEHMTKIEKPRKFDEKSFRAQFSPRIESYNEVLKVKNLQVGYDHPLATLDFTLRKGDRLAVIGPNGTGKSTFLKVIVGQLLPLAGTYAFGGNVEWGYYDQQQAVLDSLTLEKTVLEDFWDEYPKLNQEEVRSALGAFVFSGEDVEKKLGGLSGGERVRLALCKMFYRRPNFLILDEPTNHMDIIGKAALEHMLANFGGTLIFVSHDRYFISSVATSIIEIDNGTVSYYQESYEEYKKKRKKPELAKNIKTEPGKEQPGKTALKEAGLQPALAAELPLSTEDAKLFSENPGKLLSKLEKKLLKIEDKIETLEKEIKKIKEDFSDETVVTDYQKIVELQALKDKKEAEQEDMLVESMELEETIDKLREALEI